MAEYVRIADGRIAEGPCPCPKVVANISGFNHLTTKEQRTYGWVPFIAGTEPAFDPRTEQVVWRLAVTTEARSLASVEPLTDTEVAANLDSLRQELLARNADLRWQRETGGIDFYGIEREVPIPIATDRDSQHAIFQALYAGEGKNWKCRDGEWRFFTQEDFALLYASIDQHRQICFETEAENATLIQGCDTFAELDELNLESLWTSD